MPVRAYNEIYRDCAKRNISGMFDYALRIEKWSPDAFVKEFIDSGVAAKIEIGNPEYLQLSAEELYFAVTGKRGAEYNTFMTSREYTASELVSDYQWRTGKSFFEIFSVFPLSEILNFHGEQSFDFEMERRLRLRKTNLEYFRTSAGLSQSELAASSGVDIRSIQTYEQRRNDICKAQYNILSALAKALSCTVADLTDARNFRPVDNAEDEVALSLFTKQVIGELMRRQQSVTYATALEAKREARRYFYAYGYVNVFPVKKLKMKDGKYMINCDAFNLSWKMYWNGVIAAQKEREKARAAKREAVTALSPVAKDGYITPSALALSVLAAIEEIEK